MGGDIQTEKAELASLACQLRQTADGMNGQASTPPNAPNVGDSTGVVAGMLEKLTRSAAALTETAHKAASDVDASGATYGDIDEADANLFKNIG